MKSICLYLLAFVVSMGAAALSPVTAEEVTRDGKMAELLEELGHAKASHRRAALNELGRRGAEASGAVRAVAGRLNDAKGSVRQAAAEALAEIGSGARTATPALLTAARRHDHAGARAAAIQALIAISAASYYPQDERDNSLLVPVTPEVLDAILAALHEGKPSVRRSAVEALKRVGVQSAGVLPALTMAACDKDAEVRSGVAQALDIIGHEADPAVPALTRLLTDKDEVVRVDAARALWHLTKQSGPVISVLARALRPAPKERLLVSGCAKELAVKIREGVVSRVGGSDPAADAFFLAMLDGVGSTNRTCRKAAETLAEIGHPAADAIPALTTVLNGPSRELRMAAAKALWRIDRGQGRIIAHALMAAQPKQGPCDFGGQATELLVEIGPDAVEAVPALLKTLKEKNLNKTVDTRWADAERHGIIVDTDESTSSSTILEALVRIDRNVARSTLVGLLKHGSGDIRITAARALSEIDPGSGQAIGVLLAELKEPSRRLHALAILGCVGPPATRAFPQVRALLKDDDSEVQLAAAKAVWKITERPDDLLAIHQTALKSEASRLDAVVALGEMGPTAEKLAPALEELLHDPSGLTRVAAAISLWKVHPNSSAIVPTLLAIAKNRANYLAPEAVACLGEMGTAATAAIPVLKSLVNDRNPRVREAANDALRKIAPDSNGR